MNLNILILFLSFINLSVQAEVVIGVRCTTTQKFVWPVKDPFGMSVEKVVKVTNEVINEDTEQARFYAGQGAWKDCRGNLEQEFDKHWQQFGVQRSPRYIDEDGRTRPKPSEVCLQFITNPELYSCVDVTRN